MIIDALQDKVFGLEALISTLKAGSDEDAIVVLKALRDDSLVLDRSDLGSTFKGRSPSGEGSALLVSFTPSPPSETKSLVCSVRTYKRWTRSIWWLIMHIMYIN